MALTKERRDHVEVPIGGRLRRQTPFIQQVRCRCQVVHGVGRQSVDYFPYLVGFFDLKLP